MEEGVEMSLRDRVRRSMGSGVQVSWSTMPEVQSSGLLEKMSEDQKAVEELKFSLVTSEVAYNIELVELVRLCRRCITWADPLPAFNRRVIATTAERVKRCSNSFLTAMEKRWNVRPVTSMAALCDLLEEFTAQLETSITYCMHLEDLRAVLRRARKNKSDVETALFSERMNIERTLLPLQHLKLLSYLLRDIRSSVREVSSRVEQFHCTRALNTVNKLLEKCYKTLEMQHGAQYTTRLDNLLHDSVHSSDPHFSRHCLMEITQYNKTEAPPLYSRVSFALEKATPTFVSSYDFGSLDVVEENEYYIPMKPSLRRYNNSISPSRFKKKAKHKAKNLSRESVHVYEEMKYGDFPLYQDYTAKLREGRTEEHVYEEIGEYLKPNMQDDMDISRPVGTSQRIRWVDSSEVAESGLLDSMDACQIALQESKYEIISSEASYFKSLIVLDGIFVSSQELESVLTHSQRCTLFSSVMRVKRCSEKFLVALLDAWQADRMLGTLAEAVYTFITSGAFQVYVDCCADQIYRDKLMEYLKLTNPGYMRVLAELESDAACQAFTLQSFLTLPMQRVTRLPMLVQAILRRLPVNAPDYLLWRQVLVQFQNIACDCNSTIGNADIIAVAQYHQLKLLNSKIGSLKNVSLLPERKKVWNMFRLRK